MFSWEKNVPLVTSRFFIYDVIRLTFLSWIAMNLILFVMFAIFEGIESYDFNMLAVSAVIMGCLAFAILLISILFFGNRIPYKFEVDNKKASMAMISTKARVANRMTFWLGLLAGRPSVAGSGAIAASREYTEIEWKDAYKANYYPGAKIITLMNNWRAVIRLYCTAENYKQISEFVAERIAEAASTRPIKPEGRKPLINVAAIARILVISFAALLFTVSPFEVAPWLIWASWIAGITMVLIAPLRVIAGMATILGFSTIAVLNVLAGLQVSNVFDDFRANPDYRPAYANYSGFDGLDMPELATLALAGFFCLLVVIISVKTVTNRRKQETL